MKARTTGAVNRILPPTGREPRTCWGTGSCPDSFISPFVGRAEEAGRRAILSHREPSSIRRHASAMYAWN